MIKVFVDCIEGWQDCLIVKRIDDRAVVKTKNGTTLTRFLKKVENEDELIPDGSIYEVIE